MHPLISSVLSKKYTHLRCSPKIEIIPSLANADISSEVYELEFGAPDKPTIFPESGEYVGEHYIRILVPNDCIAYYTLDGTLPNESSEIYTGEFLMPTGTTTVQVIVKDENGVTSEMSQVTYVCTDADKMVM